MASPSRREATALGSSRRGERTLRRVGRPLVGALLALFLSACRAGGPAGSVEGIDAIETRNYANRLLEYYYYVPYSVAENAADAHPVLVAVPPLHGRGEEFVTAALKEFADEEGFVILSPSFVMDEANWDYRWSYQYPAVWSGEALLEIIDHFGAQQGIATSGLYLLGHSAGAQFSLRFCLWEPEECVACAAHAWGGTVRPERMVDVAFFVSVGVYDESWRVDNAHAFRDGAEQVGLDYIYREYDTGHTLTDEQISETLEFFRQTKEAASVP